MHRLWRPLIGGLRSRVKVASSQTTTTKARYFCSDVSEPAASFNEVEEFLAKHEITIQGAGAESVRPVLSFDETNFAPPIIGSLKSKFEVPSVIQSVSWPAVLTGRDLVGIARTGSGKTLAFLLPALSHIAGKSPTKHGEGPTVLVLCPTRELAQQVEAVANEWGRMLTRVRTVCAFGGAGRGPQEDKLVRGVEIVVATPGRLNDFLRCRVTNMDRCTYLVLDEADRMLDMGFEPQIREIIDRIGKERQTLMYSATWPNEVRRLASDFMKDYVYVKIGSADLAANKNITQVVHVTTQYEKQKLFWNLLAKLQEKDSNAKTLVFSLQKRIADRLSDHASTLGMYTSAIHGDKSQAARDNILRKFREGRIRVLFATDVAARGLDVDDIKYVVNYDHPFCAEDYIHRIGRTARREQTGESHTFLTEDDAGNNARELIKVLQASEQPVPDALTRLASASSGSSKAPIRRWGGGGGSMAFRGGGGGGGSGYRSENRYNQDSYSFNNRGRNRDFARYDRSRDAGRYDRGDRNSDRYYDEDAGASRNYGSSDRYNNFSGGNRKPPSAYDDDDFFDLPADNEGRRVVKK